MTKNIITEEKEDVRKAFTEVCEKIARYRGEEPTALVDDWQLNGQRIVAIWFEDGHSVNIKVDCAGGVYIVTGYDSHPSEPQYEVIRRFRSGMFGLMAAHYIESVARDIGLLA